MSNLNSRFFPKDFHIMETKGLRNLLNLPSGEFFSLKNISKDRRGIYIEYYSTNYRTILDIPKEVGDKIYEILSFVNVINTQDEECRSEYYEYFMDDEHDASEAEEHLCFNSSIFEKIDIEYSDKQYFASTERLCKYFGFTEAHMSPDIVRDTIGYYGIENPHNYFTSVYIEKPMVDNKERNRERKIYLLKDGSSHISFFPLSEDGYKNFLIHCDRVKKFKHDLVKNGLDDESIEAVKSDLIKQYGLDNESVLLRRQELMKNADYDMNLY